MWLVFKYNKKELNLFKSELKKRINSSIEFYIPKIKIKKFYKNKLCILDKEILEDYGFFYHKDFSNLSVQKVIKNSRGLKYLVENCHNNQVEIKEFINLCKKNSTEDGFIKQSFFDFSNLKKGIFLSGPFTNMFFSVLKNQKNRLKILVGDITTTIGKNSNFLYRQI